MSDQSRPYSEDDDLKRAHRFLFSSAMRYAEEAATMQGGEVAPYYEGLFAESERSIGILAFTFIESQIRDMFVQQLRPAVDKDTKKIIGHTGILDTVGKQINMLGALGWIRPETAADLRLLAKIRNRFAHTHRALKFDDHKIQGLFSSLTKHEERYAELGFDGDFPGVILQTRHKFLLRAIGTLYSLYYELTLMPSSIRAGYGPTGALGGDFDSYPQALKDALGWCMHTMILIYRHAANATPDTNAGAEK
jgi:hypothetical protein